MNLQVWFHYFIGFNQGPGHHTSQKRDTESQHLKAMNALAAATSPISEMNLVLLPHLFGFRA